MAIPEDLFLPDDEERFISSVRCYLDDDAPGLHKMTPREYVTLCRERWKDCGTDEVYNVKLLIDKRVLDKSIDSSWPLKGFKKVYEGPEPPEEIYCVSLAIVGPDGEYLGAPPDYAGPENLPGYHSVLPTRPIPKDQQDPEGPEPANYLVAVIDVLGFSKRLETIGLRQMYRLYSDLISVAFMPNVDDPPWKRLLTPIGDGLFVPALAHLPLNYAYFSDTLLMWVPLEPNRVVLFLERLAAVFCEALRLQIPLRGALSIGEAIMHKASNTYLGMPVIEAVRLEKAQLWIGLACGASFRKPPKPIPLPVTSFVAWNVPMKADSHASLWSLLRFWRRRSSAVKPASAADMLSGLVVDWPRKWRELHGGSASEALLKLRTPEFSPYYDNALHFVAYSDANPEWFVTIPGPSGARGKDV